MGRTPDKRVKEFRRRRIGVAILALLGAMCTVASGADESHDELRANLHQASIVESAPTTASPQTDPDRPADSLDSAPAIERRPIGPPGAPPSASETRAASAPSNLSSADTMLALGAVVALIFLVRWIAKKGASRVGGMAAQLGPAGRAPSGVLSVLARYPVGRGQSLVLLQMDQRVLLLNQTQEGFRPITEITDPEEVASLLIKTRDDASESLASKFTGLLKRFERDPQIIDRNEWPSRNPTTVDAAMRLFPDASTARQARPADPLDAIRRRIAHLDGGSE